MPLLQEKSGRQADSLPSARVRTLTRASSKRVVRDSSLHFGPLRAEITLVALHETKLENDSCYPEELSLLCGGAVNKRREEFALGRAAAHLALRGAGDMDRSPVLQRTGREPAWPSGFIGSITHCGPWAMAAVAKSESLTSIGIDLEDAKAVLVGEIVETICTDAEREWVLGGGNSRLKLAALFSAKEAAYKALFPLCRKFFDFHAIELTWSLKNKSFRSFHGVLREELSPDFPAGYRLEIGCQQRVSFVFTHAVIQKRASGE